MGAIHPTPRLRIGVICIRWLPFLTSGWRGANLRSGSASVIHSTPPGVRQAGLAPVSVSADAGVFHAVRGSTGTIERGFIWFVDQCVGFEMRKTKSPAALERASRAFLGKLAFRGLCGRGTVLLADLSHGETPILSWMCRDHAIAESATQNLALTLQERCG